jgi:hypothetical protein
MGYLFGQPEVENFIRSRLTGFTNLVVAPEE